MASRVGERSREGASAENALPPAADDFVREHLPEVRRYRPLCRAGEQADVWAVETERGVEAYLKRHGSTGKARQELEAHEALGGLLASWLPELVARSHGSRPMLLLRAVEGQLAEGAVLRLDERQRLHEQAGRFRRELDDVPLSRRDPLPLDEAVARRIDSWWRRAAGVVEATALREGLGRCHPDAFQGMERRWTHGDFQPRNWIVTPGGDLRVIDLGHARPNAWMIDVVKLWDDSWRAEPELEAGFWRGFGRSMTDAESAAFDTLCWIHAVATITWSREHGAAREAHGWEVLQRLLDG